MWKYLLGFWLFLQIPIGWLIGSFIRMGDLPPRQATPDCPDQGTANMPVSGQDAGPKELDTVDAPPV